MTLSLRELWHTSVRSYNTTGNSHLYGYRNIMKKSTRMHAWLVWPIVIWLFLLVLCRRYFGKPNATYHQANQRNLRQPKPPWVRHELIRLRASSPHLGCRKLAEIFNQRFAYTGIRVSKSHVADVLRQASLDIGEKK